MYSRVSASIVCYAIHVGGSRAPCSLGARNSADQFNPLSFECFPSVYLSSSFALARWIAHWISGSVVYIPGNSSSLSCVLVHSVGTCSCFNCTVDPVFVRDSRQHTRWNTQSTCHLSSSTASATSTPEPSLHIERTAWRASLACAHFDAMCCAFKFSAPASRNALRYRNKKRNVKTKKWEENYIRWEQFA